MKNPHQFYLRLATVISGQSYCRRNKVGCLIVKNDNILSFGYNGTPKGMNNCCEEQSLFEGEEDVTRKEVLHAEANAIVKCARNGLPVAGSILYTTLSPCFDCCKLIIQTGIKEVYYSEPYRDSSGLFLLSDAGIKFYLLNLEHEKETK